MPLSPPIRPTVQRFSLGELTITTLLDGEQLRKPLNPPFAMDKTEAELREIGQRNRLPWEWFRNSYTPTLIETESHRILIDVGFGASGRENGAGCLRTRLGEAGVAPEDISIVMFTHVHPDHILGVMEGENLAFPNAKHMIGRREYDEWVKGDLIPPQREKNREIFTRLIVPLADRLTFLEDGAEIAPGVTAEAAFGHSVGHMMVRAVSGAHQILVWGDACNHFVYSMQHPESPVGFDDDKDIGAATRRRVLEMAATDNLLVAGHHMPFPSIGYVERFRDAYRWTPAAYQIWT